MTREPTTAELAHDAFAQLEGMIVDVLNWAEALKAIGETPSRLDPGAIAVVGRAVDDLAGHMRDRWDAIHEAGGIGACMDKPIQRSDPDEDLKLRHDCAEVLAIKERSNGNDLADDDIALKALTDRDHHLCLEIVGTKALTARGLAAKARVVARECGLDLALVGQSPVDLDDSSLLITSLLRDVLRGPASADWQRSSS